MSEAKEPGQMAYEATPSVLTWEQQPESAKALWAITERVIRAAALEEAAKVADRYGGEWRAKAGNCYANSQGEAVCESASAAGYEIAAAIRALKEGKDG